MKPIYEKPAIYSESFELEDVICSACSTKATYDENSCPVHIPGLGTIFNEDTGGCEYYADIDICYHVAKPGENVFSSEF